MMRQMIYFHAIHGVVLRRRVQLQDVDRTRRGEFWEIAFVPKTWCLT